MEVNKFYSPPRLIFVILLIVFSAAAVLFSQLVLISQPSPETASTTMHQERGTIFDRNGKILAIQNTLYHIVVTPAVIKDITSFAKALSPAIDMSVEEIEQKITEAPSTFFYLKKKIPQSEHDDILAIKEMHGLSGLRLESVTSRAYPENQLAAHVIGFMGDSGEGLSGMEYSFQRTLAPPQEYVAGIDLYGDSIVTTIDASLQYKLEQIALESLEDTQAESFMLIAAEATTGEILSYISLPSPNLNTYPSSSIEEQQDRPANTAYEPGSVFKVFSVASFVDSGAISPTDSFYCDGIFEMPSPNGDVAPIKCLGHHGWVTAREALAYSCNDALAQMSERITPKAFINRIKSFGFGSKTGIELPGETAGSVKNPGDRLWSIRSKPTISIGQEMSVSALQMVQGTTALANEGVPVKLSLLSKILDSDGNVKYSHKPTFSDPILSAETANYLLSTMETTARAGTGIRAAINDITIGVKTGTAQLFDSATGKYSETDFVSNCISVFPIENPQVILYIVITKAKGETLSGRIVAPIIGEAADVIIDHLGLVRESAMALTHSGTVIIPQSDNTTIGEVVPDFTGLPKRALIPLLDHANINLTIIGDGWVVSQTPPPGTPVTENIKIELTLQ